MEGGDGEAPPVPTPAEVVTAEKGKANADAGPSGTEPAQEESSGMRESSSEEASTSKSSGAGGSGSKRHTFHKKPVVVIVIGMAGSGKTTLMQQLNAHLHQERKWPYIVNLDPAVSSLPYGANIDIRDTVNYKNVMKEYNLGPNGGILTALNLFATKFDEVVQLVEKRAHDVEYVLVDTPGQIEIFTWSASGAVVTEAFASTFPTVVVYVVDTPRAASPVTFMSNMLYACGILYKSRLPLLLAFNKTDIVRHEFATEWMADFETFQAALQGDSSYASSLSNSLCLVLDEFYSCLQSVGVSAITGMGLPQFFAAVDKSAEEYMASYRVELEGKRADQERQEEERKKANWERVEKDIKEAKGAKVVVGRVPKPKDDSPVSSNEDEDDEDGDDDDDDEDDYI